MCYNIPTKTDFHCMEMEALSGLLEATCKTFSTLKGYIMITQQRLKELLHYDKDTGIFTRLHIEKAIGIHKSYIGKPVGTDNGKGYLTAGVDGKRYKLHRLVFMYINGSFPDGQVDHTNGNRKDNRLSNLMVVTNSGNQRNRRRQHNNTSGTTGVYYNKTAGKWISLITINSKSKSLGYYRDKEDAIKARKEAEIKYGYHPNHDRSNNANIL